MAGVIREYVIVLEDHHDSSVTVRQKAFDGADAAGIAQVFFPRHTVRSIEPVAPPEDAHEEPRRVP